MTPKQAFAQALPALLLAPLLLSLRRRRDRLT